MLAKQMEWAAAARHELETNPDSDAARVISQQIAALLPIIDAGIERMIAAANAGDTVARRLLRELKRESN